MDAGFARSDATLERGLAEVSHETANLQSELRATQRGLDARFARFETTLTRWMFGFWLGTIGMLIALIKL